MLHDDCSDNDDGGHWIVPKDANTTESETEGIINLGCTKKLKGIQMKNLKREDGGTRSFVIYVSEMSDGPWDTVLEAEFSRQDTFGCASMQNFKFE